MIETPRLHLRRPRAGDVDAVFAYRSRPDVARHLSAGVWTREHTATELANAEQASFRSPGDELVLLAETRDGQIVIGEVGLLRTAQPEVAEIGYVFNPAFGGLGFASEAVGAVVCAAFARWQFATVIATTDAENLASRALCERLGMRWTGTELSTDGRGVRECTYAIRRPT